MQDSRWDGLESLHALLAFFERQPRSGCRPIDASLHAINAVLPRLDISYASRRWSCTSPSGGWYCLQPETGPLSELISQHVEEDLAVLAFGVLFGQSVPGRSTAGACAAAWRKGGPRSIQELDGSFGAVLVARAEKAVYMVSDLAGRRSLRYLTLPNAIVVSSHDLPIVGTGLLEPELDPVSAASVLAMEWSVAGRSLVRGIESCDSAKFVKWQQGEITTQRGMSPVDPREKLELGDQRAIETRRDEIIEIMRTQARTFCANHSRVELDLTAGIHSRTVLTLALSAVPPERLIATTAGRRDSPDVRTARLLARWYGLQHEVAEPGTDNVYFGAHLQLRAYATNGMTDAKRAADALPSATGRTATLSGTNGELFRGIVYGGIDRETLRLATSDIACSHLVGCYVRSLPWSDPRLADDLVERVAESVSQAAGMSRLLGDLLDLFCLREKGRFAGAAKFTWLEPVHAPFESPSVTRLAHTLPAPIGHNMALHKTIIRRYAGKAYWLPVNHKYVLPLAAYADSRSWGLAARTTARVLSASYRLVDSIRFSRSGDSPATHDMVRLQTLAEMVRGPLRDWFVEEDSVSRRLLDKGFVGTLLDKKRSTLADHMRTIGFLATLEQWRKLVHETNREALEYARTRGPTAE